MGADDEKRREAARALAERLATPEGLLEARRLQAAGRLAEIVAPWEEGGHGGPPLHVTDQPSGEAGSIGPSRPRRPEPISIWQPRDDPDHPSGTIFVRPEPQPLGDHHAVRRVLRPKRATLPLRVVLFGESVAAGYLYAPHLTPAQVLESRLQSIGGAKNFEVIDLARTNERLPTLAHTVRAALQIQPDVLVLYAGNNWNLLETPEASPYAPSVAARLDYAQALREGGLEGAVRLAEGKLREIAELSLDLIALIAHTVQIPVVLVIPEVSLADWETRQPPHWLPGEGLANWYAELEAGLERLEAGDWEPARARAQSMLALDGGRCATSWRLLARAEQGRRAMADAAEAAQREIDAAPYATLGFLSAPQVTAFARNLLLGKAAEHGWRQVDLSEVFSPLPGRDLFLDYCHLTAKGMEVAMAAVAEEVIEVSGLVDAETRRPATALEVPPTVEATACLGAALHTAHRHLPVGPKGPLLEHWLERAVEADPGIVEAMRDLLHIRTSPLPAILTQAQRRNFDSPYRLLLQHGLRWEHLDADLLLALAEVLERHGVPAREEMGLRLIAGFLPGERGSELTEPPFLWEPLERFFPDVMEFDDLPPRGYLRAPWPESSFCLVGDGKRDLAIEANLRLPPVPGGDAARTGDVVVRVNGERRGTVPATERWTRSILRLNAPDLHPGLNRLTLRWPMPPALSDAGAPLRAALERLEIGVAADLHPVFGEVYSLVARRA